MNRYPDEIIILKAEGGDPYHAPSWQLVYRGRCRCFLDRQAAFRTNKVMDCSYQVVIPDRYMEEIGENFKVGVRMHTSKTTRYWDLVGFVKDFARYDRVCNLYFQMVKENLIYEDIPQPIFDEKKRNLQKYEDDWFRIESVGMIEHDIILEDEVVSLEFKKGYIAPEEEGDNPTFGTVKFFQKNAQGEWVETNTPQCMRFLSQYQEGYFDENTQEYVHRGGAMANTVYVFVGTYNRSGQVDPEVSDAERNTIRIEVWNNKQDEEPWMAYETEIKIVSKGAKTE